MDWAPASLVAVPMTVAPWADRAWAMACPIPRLAPVTSATFPSRLISVSLGKLGKGCGKAVHAVQVVSRNTFGAALVQARQHLAGTTFNQIGDTLGGHVFHTLDPAHRTVQLFDQLAAQRIQIRRRPGRDVLHQSDLRRLPAQPGKILRQLLGSRPHQRTMRRHTDRKSDGTLRTSGLATVDGPLHSSGLTGDHHLPRGIELLRTDHLTLRRLAVRVDVLLISEAEDRL